MIGRFINGQGGDQMYFEFCKECFTRISFKFTILYIHLPHMQAQNIGRALFDNIYANRLIGRGRPVRWPARSSDLTKPDFFLWGL